MDRCYIVQVLAALAYLGNHDDPLFWHFSVRARTDAEALAIIRRGKYGGIGARVIHSFLPDPAWGLPAGD